MQKIISKYFDEFSTMSEASHNAVLEIANREGIEMNKIIVATSFCFDELNHQPAKMNLPSPQEPLSWVGWPVIHSWAILG